MTTLVVDVVFWAATVLATGGVGAFLLRTAGVVLLSVVTSKLFGPKIPSQVAGLSEVSIMTRSAVEYRKRVYGQAIVSGPVVYNNLSGSDNKYLWYVIALAEGEIEGLVEVHLDGDVIPVADIAWSPGANGADGAGTGEVSTSTFQDSDSNSSVDIYWTLGHANQLALSKLTTAFADFTSAHRLRGIAYLVVKMRYDEASEEVFRNGAPQNIRAVIKGSKLYDSRKDSTNGGAGAHRLATASTWEWSDNPALALADYQTQVMDVGGAAMDWPSIAAAADDCDVLVDVPPAASPANTETRFTCNGVISYGAPHKDNLDNLLSACDGKLAYSAGTWKLRASVWEASSVSITDDDLAGAVQVQGSAVAANRKNTVRGVFIDPSRGYEPNEFPLAGSATYTTRDAGKERQHDLTLPMTNSETMGQRIAYRILEQFDNQVVVKLTLKAMGLTIAIGDVCDLTLDKFSWSAKTFRCIEWQRNPDSTYDVTLREDTSSRYTDPLVANYGTAGVGGAVYPSDTIAPPTGLTATGVPYGIRLDWTNPAAGTFDYIDLYESATSAWSGATKIASVRTNTYTRSLPSGESRFYWARARREPSLESVRIPNSDTSTITATSQADAIPVQLTGAALSNILITNNDAEVSYRLASTGEEQSYEGDGGTHTDIADWLLEGAAGDYDCRLTVNSGTNPTGSSLATWLDMSTTRTWTLTDTSDAGGVISNNCTVEIRDGTTLDILASVEVTMQVQKQPAAVTLSGTTSNPNRAYDFEESPADASAGWDFNSDGTVDRLNQDVLAQFNSATEWIKPNNPSSTYYIRATNHSGSNPSTGPALNTAHALTTNRSWRWTETGIGNTVGVLKIEIATDSGMTNIVATGYYEGEAEVEITA